MPLNAEQKTHLDQIAKACVPTIIQKRAENTITDKSVNRSIEFSAPNVITKRAENDEGFMYTRFFKSLLRGTDSPEMELVTKAMSTSDDSLGGYLVPPQQSAEIIDFLGARAVIRQMGCDIMPMTTGTLPVPKITGGVTTYYLGENVEATPDNVGTGQVVLHARSIVALVPLSNQLLADASPQAERSVRNTMTRSIGIAETESFLQATGGVKPLGLLRLPNKISISSVAKATLTYDDIVDLVTSVENAESEVTGFLTTPSILGQCRKIKDDDGQPILQNALDLKGGVNKTLMGVPVKTTTKCKLGTTHYLIAADWSGEIVIGQRMSLEFAVSEHVEFKKNQTLIRAIMRHDIVSRHEEAIACLPVTGW